MHRFQWVAVLAMQQVLQHFDELRHLANEKETDRDPRLSKTMRQVARRYDSIT